MTRYKPQKRNTKSRYPQRVKRGTITKEELFLSGLTDSENKLYDDTPIEAIRNIGPKKAKELRDNQIYTVGDFRKFKAKEKGKQGSVTKTVDIYIDKNDKFKLSEEKMIKNPNLQTIGVQPGHRYWQGELTEPQIQKLREEGYQVKVISQKHRENNIIDRPEIIEAWDQEEQAELILDPSNSNERKVWQEHPELVDLQGEDHPLTLQKQRFTTVEARKLIDELGANGGSLLIKEEYRADPKSELWNDTRQMKVVYYETQIIGMYRADLTGAKRKAVLKQCLINGIVAEQIPITTNRQKVIEKLQIDPPKLTSQEKAAIGLVPFLETIILSEDGWDNIDLEDYEEKDIKKMRKYLGIKLTSPKKIERMKKEGNVLGAHEATQHNSENLENYYESAMESMNEYGATPDQFIDNELRLNGKYLEYSEAGKYNSYIESELIEWRNKK